MKAKAIQEGDKFKPVILIEDGTKALQLIKKLQKQRINLRTIAVIKGFQLVIQQLCKTESDAIVEAESLIKYYG